MTVQFMLYPFQTLYISNGGQLLDYHRVLRVIPGPVITIETDRGSFKSKKIVITAGAWTNQLLETVGLKLPLKVGDQFNIIMSIYAI